MIDEIDRYLKLLFPINRSITGLGNRETLKILQQIIPLKVFEYMSGTQVYDWVIPDEWNIKDAWIKDANGNKLVDFKKCNIHIISYSEPVDKRLTFKDLESHLFVHDKISNAIPYRTSYYKKDWGFCVTQAQYKILKQTVGFLEVKIDSVFNNEGSLTLGELLIPGQSEQEILISTYICHPSLANDNLSGLILTAFLARELLNRKHLKYSYRIIWVPETIGAITYCSMNEASMKKIDMGLVITTVGGPGIFGYKESWQADHPLNKLIERVLVEAGKKFVKYPFDIHGSDERQYSSQGFRINVATISKDKYYEYPEYHTSLDNTSFVNARQISESLELYVMVIDKLESRRVYQNLIPNCEVMLSQHGLYPNHGGFQNPKLEGKIELDLILWLLFLCDGVASIDEISEKMDFNIASVEKICNILSTKGILKEI